MIFCKKVMEAFDFNVLYTLTLLKDSTINSFYSWIEKISLVIFLYIENVQ